MSFTTIAILSPGNMGSGIGKFLAESGYVVVTSLAGRSDFTRKRALERGFADAGSIEGVVERAELVLSVLDPARAVEIAEQVAAAMKTTGKGVVFADCNATSPATAEKLATIIEEAGGTFIDVGIIGGTPTRRENFPMLATSGAKAVLLDELDGKGVKILNVGLRIGQGSAIKICNGAWNKGAFALYTAVMLAAEKYGFTDILRERLPGSQAGTVEKIDAAITRLPSLSGRYIGEMEQVAETFAAIGMPAGFHAASAELFRMLDATSLAAERREQIDPDRTPLDVLKLIVAELDRTR
jgi:3-hydroxyisobutyrate dehydrogenase-like beta-hydroxyacid dehydrogenase